MNLQEVLRTTAKDFLENLAKFFIVLSLFCVWLAKFTLDGY